MLRKWIPCWMVLGVALAPGLLRAQDAGPDAAPTVSLRIRSFDTLIDNIKTVARAVDQAEVGDQIDQLLKAQVGPNGLDGIDTKRPWGLYARVSADFSNPGGVALIPVSNEKAFLKLLENLNYPAKKDDSGVYVVDQQLAPVQIGFRFANKYAYVTVDNFDILKDNALVRPAELFPANDRADVAASLRIDQIPAQFKQFAIAKMEEELAKEKEKQEEGETAAERQFKVEFIDWFGRQVADFLRGGKELALEMDVDPKAETMTFELLVSGGKKSRLAKSIADVGQGSSLFGGLLSDKAALSGLVNLKLPEELRKAMEPLIEEGMAKALAKEKNAKERQHAEAFLKVLEPSLKSGELDVAALLTTADDNKGTMVFAVKLRDGLKVEQTVKQISKDLPPKEREKLKLDVAKVGNVNVHQIDAQGSYDDKARELFGDTPVLLAFRDDALYFVAGQDGMGALKRALQGGAKATPSVHVAALMRPLIEVGAKKKSEKDVARQVFSAEHPGLIRFTMEGGDALRVRFVTGLSLLRFGVEIDRLRKEVLAPQAGH